jgi:hypothetical protein
MRYEGGVLEIDPASTGDVCRMLSHAAENLFPGGPFEDKADAVKELARYDEESPVYYDEDEVGLIRLAAGLVMVHGGVEALAVERSRTSELPVVTDALVDEACPREGKFTPEELERSGEVLELIPSARVANEILQKTRLTETLMRDF